MPATKGRQLQTVRWLRITGSGRGEDRRWRRRRVISWYSWTSGFSLVLAHLWTFLYITCDRRKHLSFSLLPVRTCPTWLRYKHNTHSLQITFRIRPVYFILNRRGNQVPKIFQIFLTQAAPWQKYLIIKLLAYWRHTYTTVDPPFSGTDEIK